MIDLHCHLGIGVDDGCQTPEDAKALALALSRAGVTHVACTSHLRRNRSWLNDTSVQNSLHTVLNQVLGDTGPERFRGAEHYLDEMLLETCRAGNAVPYGNSKKWILLELPYDGEPPELFKTLFAIRSLGYKLLLAHLERYPYIYQHEDKIETLLNAGYWIQTNLGSFAGVYGEQYQKAAEYLLAEDYVHVLAGDCHNATDVEPCIIRGLEAVSQLTDSSTLELLTRKNPAHILGI